MSLAIFGITNNGLNLAATLFLLMLVVLWLALIVYTYLDARRRISDPFLIACGAVRVRRRKAQPCPNSESQTDKNSLRCPNCRRRLRAPGRGCAKPVAPRW